MRNFILFIMLSIVSFSCEDAIDKPLASEDVNILVVEGIVTSEKTSHQIKLTHSYTTQNATPQPATGATVTISEDIDVFTLAELPAGSGLYYTPEMRAVTGKKYTLTIQYEGKEYAAQDSPVPIEPMPALQYNKANDLYHLTTNPSGESPNFITHTLQWANTPSCAFGTSCKGFIVFYDLKTIDINGLYKPDKEDFNFPLNTTVIRTKYSVSPAYKTFLRSLLSETEWRGGVFDVIRDNTTTNLSNGAVGFFATATILSDTTIVAE